MLVVGHDVDFGKYGIARVTVIDPNVTPESQKRREEEVIRVVRKNLERMQRMQDIAP